MSSEPPLARDNGAMSYYPNQPWPSDPMPNQWDGQTRRPPVIPFRPLTLGNLFDGTFAAIRSNPRVMFAISLGAMLVVGVLTGIVSALVPEPWVEEVLQSNGGTVFSEVVPAWQASYSAFEGAVSIITAAATLLVIGMLVLSVTNAVIGINLDLKGTWSELKPHFWRLVGTALLVWLILGAVIVAAVVVPILFTVGLALGGSDNPSGGWVLFVGLLGLAGLVLAAWLSVRLYFATVVVVVEGASPTAALGRSWALTKGAFWRTLGRLLLMTIIVAIASGLIGGVISAVTMFFGSFLPWGITAFLLTLISSLVTGLVIPFSAGYVSLMYVDERFRKENLAPTLQEAFEQNSR